MPDREPPRLTSAFSFTNGMTIAFDQHGQQMPEYGGRTTEAVPKIRAAGFTGKIPYGSYAPPPEGSETIPISRGAVVAANPALADAMDPIAQLEGKS